MASNKELMSDITTLCIERGVAVPDGLDQLKNPKLVELLDDLRQAPPPSPVVETALRPLVAASPPDGPVSGGPGDAAPSPTPASAPTAPVSEQSASTAAPTPKPAPTGAGGYYVAAGKTVSTLRRETQGAYEQVYASDFSDGQAALDGFLASGYLFKR